MTRTAVCIDVKGDEGEFDDLIGEVGTLRIDPKRKDSAVNWFNGGGGVNFTRKQLRRMAKLKYSHNWAILSSSSCRDRVIVP